MPKFCQAVGNQPSPLLYVGEAPGANEEEQGIPLVGSSGDELLRMFLEAGVITDRNLLRDFQPGASRDTRGYTLGHMVAGQAIPSLRLTNVSSRRPPGNKIDNFFLNKTEAKKQAVEELNGQYPLPSLRDDIELLNREVQDTNPDVIIAGGNTALWALTGEFGITKWRGSVLPTINLVRPSGKPYKVIPTIHPAAILRQWTQRAITVHDFRQRVPAALVHPDYVSPWDKFNFITVPSYDAAKELLGTLVYQLENTLEPIPIAVDIETFFRSQISSIAFAVDSLSAFCIPILCSTDHRGYWTFDQEFELVMMMRYILSHKNAHIIGQNYSYDMQYIHRLWCIQPQLYFDTRTAQRVAFPSMPASLDYLASMYNTDHQYWKDENKEAVKNEDDERRWRYNCRDAVETFEAHEGLSGTIAAFGLNDQFRFEMALHPLAFYIGQRGIRAREPVVNAIRDEIRGEMLDYEGWFLETVGSRVNATSKAKPWWRSSSQVASLLFDWFKIRPELDRKTRRPTTKNDHFPTYCAREPLVTPILKRLDDYRTKMMFLGTVLDSKRFNGRFVTDYIVPGTETFRFASRQNAFSEGLNLQNVAPKYRVIFGPDPGFIWWDADLDRADAQVVAWEADDKPLKEAFRQGLDIHQVNADDIGCTRDEAKAGVHATNYGGQAHTLSNVLNISKKDAQYFIDKWFEKHPAIKNWHLRTEAQVQTHRFVENKFGFRRQFFERAEDAFTEALAWIPQSTVAIVINKGLLRIWTDLMPKYLDDNNRYLIEVMTQTHDSGGGQWHESIDQEIRPQVRDCLTVPIPYDDPLTIPVGLKTSHLSWGDVKESPWEISNVA